MQKRILHELSAAIPALKKWEQIEQGDSAGCLQDEAEIRDLGLQGAYQRVPEEMWGTVVSIIGRIAASYGFERTPLVLRDKPGDHDVTFHNVNDDSSISIGTKMNTSLSVNVGCHLTAEAKRRGQPKTPTY